MRQSPCSSPGLAGIKNIMRGALLATAATFLGCALFFTLPDLIASQLNRTMPYWFYESEVRMWLCACACPGKSHMDTRDMCHTSLHLQRLSMPLSACCGSWSGLVRKSLTRMCVAVQTTLLTVGTALTNWVMSSFFR